MSLQVWLPLNGDLHNQGLSDIDVQLMGSVPYTAGKIGNVATFSNNAANCIHFPGLKQNDNFTWVCWLKLTAASSNYQYVLSEGRDTGYAGVNLIINSNSHLYFRYGGNNTGVTRYIGDLSDNAWHHVAAIYSSSGCSAYFDGTLVDTWDYVAVDYTQSNDSFVIGKMAYSYTNTGSYFPFNGQVCDVRIYDHCLSPKEVKELSKGLIAHYPLNDGVGGENLIADSYRTRTCEYPSSGVQDFYYVSTSKVPSGTTYILSFYAKSTVNGDHLRTHYYNPNTTTKSVSSQGVTRTSPDGVMDFTLTTEWKHYWVVYTQSETTAVKRVICPRLVSQEYSATASGTGVVSVKLVKFEEGSVPTPWIPNPNDALYSAMGLDNGICYDTSGYGHNGEYHNTTKVTTDTPRYSIAPLWDVNVANNVIIYDIQTTNLNTSFTVACWAYINDYSRMPWCSIGGNNLNLYVSGSKFYYNTFDGTNNPFQDSSGTVVPATQYINSWHHYAVTGDGTTAKLYVDGVYLGSAKTWKPFNATDFSINGPNNANYKVRSVSDLRIYATALSAEDIKQLYEVSASIDNTGNVYGSEVVE